MDARNWQNHGTSFLEVAGPTIIPLGDRAHARVAAAAETFEIVRTGKYLVLEGEVGSHRIRAGKLAARITASGNPFNSATDSMAFTGPHGYETGDGPLHVTSQAMMSGNPSITISGGNTIVRATGSFLADGFSGAVIVAVNTTPGGGANNVLQFSFGISTTTNPNDTLTTFGPLTNETVASDALITRATLPANVSPSQDFWVIVTSPTTIKLATSRANALAGVAFNVADADDGFDTCVLGGDQGPYFPAGWTPSTPAFSTKRGEGEKLIRAGEQFISTARAVTVRSQAPGDVLKWWSIG